MYISSVSIRNYRNFANASFKFNKGINTIIGENGSGKTNVFRAIRLLLEDSSYQFAYKLDEGDFNRSIGDWRGHWIIISIEFDEISSDEAIQSLFIHGIGTIGATDPIKKATYNLYFRPRAEIRAKLSELKAGDKDGMNTILSSITVQNDYETFFAGKSTANFNDEAVYRELVGDFENVKFNFNIDTSKFGIKIPHQLSVSKEISFTFIKALRDVVAEFHNNRTNPLITLLRNKSGEIKKEDYDPISKLVTDLNSGIENLPDVQKIRADIKETIKDAVGETYSPSSLSIKSSLSDEADKLLQSLKLFIGEPDETYEGGIHELSLGGANLIFLTLKLLEYKYQKSKEKFAHFLIIEEPEAHIHTHIQKTLFDRLDYGDTQIIYSTHSTFISEVSNISNMNILAKKQNFAEVYQPATSLAAKESSSLKRYLDAVRSNLLFAKGVILIEGDAEEILIPPMIKEVLGISLDELGISLINIRSTGFKNVAQIFHDERIKRRCSILTDLDTKICDTTITAGDSEDVKNYKTKVENSHQAGLRRKTDLDSFANVWVKPFYAKHTFEVNFLAAGNQWEVKKIIDKCYTGEKFIEEVKNELDSKDISVCGKRILTMAKQEGKGWFALMLGEHINPNTIIPMYILNSIVFVRETFNNNLLTDIVKYRMKKNYEADNKLDYTSTKKILVEFENGTKSLKDVLDEFVKVSKDDSSLRFLNLFV
jgi:putative ATP-dependent endonuclease of the OLD family